MRMVTDKLSVPSWHGANAMGSIACYDLNKAFLFNEMIQLWILTVFPQFSLGSPLPLPTEKEKKAPSLNLPHPFLELGEISS